MLKEAQYMIRISKDFKGDKKEGIHISQRGKEMQRNSKDKKKTVSR
jgi:hypothetical protein